MDTINENHQKFEPYAAMVDKTCENLNSEFVDNQDAHGQIENDETGEPIYIHWGYRANWQNSKVHESNLGSGDFILKIATDDAIGANIRSFKPLMATSVGKKLCKECFFKKTFPN